MHELLSFIVSGLAVGALYALLAIGFALIFGITRIFHVAHGGVFLVAAYVYYSVTIQGGLSPVIGTVCAVAGALGSGALIYVVVYEHMLKTRRAFFPIFVASFGVLVVIQNALSLHFGVNSVSFGSPLLEGGQVGGVEVTRGDVVSIAVAVVSVAGIALFLRGSHTGRRMRALAQSPTLFAEYGLSPRRYRALAYGIGCVLVVPGAIILGYLQGLSPADGATVTTVAIVATIAGGVGSLLGSGLAGLGFGIASVVSGYWLPGGWTDAVAFGLFFAVLVWRPDGLMVARSGVA